MDCTITDNGMLVATRVDCTVTGCTTPKLNARAFQHRQQSKLCIRLHHTQTTFTGALQSPATPGRNNLHRCFHTRWHHQPGRTSRTAAFLRTSTTVRCMGSIAMCRWFQLVRYVPWANGVTSVPLNALACIIHRNVAFFGNGCTGDRPDSTILRLNAQLH